jgi:Ca2+-transporting ATPase
MAIGTLSLLFYELQTGTSQHATTMAFTSFVLFQLFNVFNARSEKHSTFNHYFFTNRMLWLAIISVIVLQILVINWTPAQNIFKTTPLSQLDWLIAVAVASTILILEELRKLLRQLIS